jgi:hypothetical protein
MGRESDYRSHERIRNSGKRELTMKKQLIILSLLALANLANGQMFAQLFGQSEAAWTPAALGSKVAIWYDASDAATVLDADGNPADNAEAVQTWSDKSGNSRHATAPDAAQRPTRQAAVQNGLAVLRTGGASQLNIASAGNVFRNKTAGYIFVVAKDANQASGDTTHVVAFFSTASAGNVRAVLYSRSTDTKWTAAGRRADNDTLKYAITTAAANHTQATAFFDWGNGNVRCGINAGAYTSTEYSSGAGSSADTDSAAVALFRFSTNNEMPANSEIAEIIIVNAAMTDAEVTATQTYLKTKWGTP